ncbi:MAG: ABC transporter substrate-binding protein [Burkholderiaceae bacterium]
MRTGVAAAVLALGGAAGSRRAWAAGAAGAGPDTGTRTAGAGEDAGTTRELTVLTSYQTEVVTRFERAFEHAHPRIRLRIVWRPASESFDFVRQPGRSGIDVVWAASPRLFDALAEAGALVPAGVDRRGLPDRVGGTRIDDPSGRYLATELAGYGFAIHPGYLARHHLPVPRDWPDLADPRYDGHLLVPNPNRVGFAPVLADIPLQAYGWQAGWAIWSRIMANARSAGSGGPFLSDALTQGQAGIAPSIDFFVASAIARGAPLQFVYPRQGGINPGHVALLQGSPHADIARRFIDFVLSDAGQSLLLHPDIRKLPVRPGVYAKAPAGYHDPFATAARGGYRYDNARGRPRLSALAALFDASLVAPLPRLQEDWRAWYAAERDRDPADGRRRAVLAAARRLLEAPGATEAELDDPSLQAIFEQRRRDPASAARAEAIERRWQAQAAERLARAAALLDR